jgi:hypothetical protein
MKLDKMQASILMCEIISDLEFLAGGIVTKEVELMSKYCLTQSQFNTICSRLYKSMVSLTK